MTLVSSLHGTQTEENCIIGSSISTPIMCSPPRLPPPCTQCGYYGGILNKIPPPAPPMSLVRSPYFPNPFECSTIAEIDASCDDYIRNLEVELSNLQSRLSAIRKYKQFNCSLLSPIRKLPDEILAQIFTHVCAEAINICDTQRGYVWDLRRVCIRWRCIVDDTPLLWNRFKVKITDNETMANSVTIIRQMQSCLEYSRTAPLEISLPHSSLLPLDIDKQVFEMISNHADRLASFDVDMGYFSWRESDSTAVAPESLQLGGLGQLRKLILRNSYYAFHVFETAFALQEMELYGIALPENIFSIPLTNIRRLAIRLCSPAGILEAFYSALRTMSLLEELTLDNNEFYDNPALYADITLPSLHTLSIVHNFDNYNRPTWPGICSLLCVPSLTRVKAVLNVNWEDSEPIISMIRKSGCIIKQFSCATDNSYIIDVFNLYALPEIQELYLQGVEQTDGILDALVWKSTEQNLLPALQKLVVSTSREDLNHVITTLMDIMCSRSSVRSSYAMDGQNLSPTQLLSIKCIVDTAYLLTDDENDETTADLSRLENLGEELGINVVTEVMIRFEGEELRDELN